MDVRETVLNHLAAVVEEHSPLPFPDDPPDEMLLEDFWLDSLAYSSLITAIEADVGFIPSEILKGQVYPQTIGELVEMYAAKAHDKRER